MFLLHLEMTVLIGSLCRVYDVEAAFSKHIILPKTLSFFPRWGVISYNRRAQTSPILCSSIRRSLTTGPIFIFSHLFPHPHPTTLCCVMCTSLYSHFLSGCEWGGYVGPSSFFGYSTPSLYKNGHTLWVCRCVDDTRGNWIPSPLAGAGEPPSVWIWVCRCVNCVLPLPCPQVVLLTDDEEKEY